MKISEFCKIYKVHHQNIYRAIRKDTELEGHVYLNSHNVKELDDYAVEYLKPKRTTAEKYNEVCEKNTALENRNCFVEAENMTIRDEMAEYKRGYEQQKAVADFANSEADKYRELSLEKDKTLRYNADLIDEKDRRIAELTEALEVQRKLCTQYEADILVKDSEIDDLRKQVEMLTEERGKGIFGFKKK